MELNITIKIPFVFITTVYSEVERKQNYGGNLLTEVTEMITGHTTD